MKELLPQFDFCVFDLETTGLNPGDDTGIIEVGAVKLTGGSETDTFQSFADPGHSIPGEITNITGITDDDIEGADPSKTVLNEFLDFVDNSILIAHNAPFDLSFLKYFASTRIDHDYIDTLRLSRQLLTAESHSLSNLARSLDLTLDRAHRALEDAIATKELFLHLTEKVTETEDYFRCDLPPSLLESAPVDVPRPDLPTDESDHTTGCSPTDWILYALYELDASIGVTKLAQILSGSRSEAVQKYTSINSYGQLDELTQSRVKEAIQDTLEDGLIEQSDKPYPVLGLTDEGIDHLIELSETAGRS